MKIRDCIILPPCKNSHIITLDIIELIVFAKINGNNHFLLIIVKDNTRPITKDLINQMTPK